MKVDFLHWSYAVREVQKSIIHCKERGEQKLNNYNFPQVSENLKLWQLETNSKNSSAIAVFDWLSDSVA